MYSTNMGRSFGSPAAVAAAAAAAQNADAVNGGGWLHYIFYFLAALMFVWGILFAMIRSGVVGPNHWLYEKTKLIPGLGENSLARNAVPPPQPEHAPGSSDGARA